MKIKNIDTDGANTGSEGVRMAENLNVKEVGFSDEELTELIQAYYDCRLTDDEEEMLGRVLAVSKSNRAEIEEARAVMGFRGMADFNAGHSRTIALKSKVDKARRKHRILTWISAWAAAAVMAGLVATVYFRVSGEKDAVGTPDIARGNVCIAYSNGRTITDEDDIIALIGENLSDFEEAREDVDELFLSELGSAAETIDNMQNEIILPEL